MQTFLPSPDYSESAKFLDRQRLGKQRVEAYQILRSLRGESNGWLNHPTVKMWRGHELQLILYTIAICNEWTSRGYKDTIKSKVLDMIPDHPDNSLPKWLGNEYLHLTHRSNLVRKLPEYYCWIFPNTPNDLPYYWPTEETK